jgi:HEAT repeat protein
MPDDTLAQRAAQGDVDAAAQLLTELDSEDPQRQADAARALSDSLAGGLAAQLLRFAATGVWGSHSMPYAPMGSEAHHNLSRAAISLLLSDAAASLPALLAGLRHRDPQIRRAAARLLGEMGAEGDVLPPLRFLLLDSSPLVAGEAARALVRLRDPQAAQSLVAALGSAHPDARGAIGDALLALGAAVLEPLEPALHDEREHVRWYATRVLAATREPRAAPWLAHMLNDTSVGIRWLAEVGLRRLPPLVAVEAVLRELTRERLVDWERGNAAWLLARYSGPLRTLVEPVRQALQSSLARGEAPLRATEALHALEALKRDEGVRQGPAPTQQEPAAGGA